MIPQLRILSTSLPFPPAHDASVSDFYILKEEGRSVHKVTDDWMYFDADADAGP